MQLVDSYPQFAGVVDLSEFDYGCQPHRAEFKIGPDYDTIPDLDPDDPIHSFAVLCDADAREHLGIGSM